MSDPTDRLALRDHPPEDWAIAKAREWLDGLGGEACLASDQSGAVPLLAALLRQIAGDPSL